MEDVDTVQFRPDSAWRQDFFQRLSRLDQSMISSAAAEDEANTTSTDQAVRSDNSRKPPADDSRWQVVLNTLQLSDVRLLKANKSTSRRLYTDGRLVYKIWIHDKSWRPDQRQDGLEWDYRIRRQCAGIPGVATPLLHGRGGDVEVMIYPYIAGSRVANMTFGPIGLLRITGRLCLTLWRMSWRGIAHNDLHGKNVLITKSGQSVLIDFEYATLESRIKAIRSNFFRIRLVMHKYCGSLVRFVGTEARRIVRRWLGKSHLHPADTVGHV